MIWDGTLMGPSSAKGSVKGREHPRIGVFICHCGVNIGGFVDVPKVVDYAATLDGVAHAEGNLYTCAEDGLQAIKNAIKEHKLNRVIVASCTPRTHEPLFRAACVEAGLNKYLFEMANIREHCSWVHMDQRAEATDKAKELVRMAVARSKMLEPLEEGTLPVKPSALVIGGGVAGISAALAVARQGFLTHLIERKGDLGGFVKDIDFLFKDYIPGHESIKPLVEEVEAHDKIVVHTTTEVKAVDGFIGDFHVTLDKKGHGDLAVDVGTIIVATGGEVLTPDGLYGYGNLENVVTLHEFEGMVRKKAVPPFNRVAFIQCAGSRGQRVSYCSRICCNSTIKEAIMILENKEGLFASPASSDEEGAQAEAETKPGKMMRRRRRAGGPKPGGPAPQAGKKEVLVFYRDIMAYGTDFEFLYNKAREKGAMFIKYEPDRIPEVEQAGDGDKLRIKYFHTTLQQELVEEVDMVVLATPIIPAEGAKELSQLLKVPLGQDGFFFEAHVKLRPVDFATDGIFLCGTAKGPADIGESISQAQAAASRASVPLTQGKVLAGGAIAVVDPEKCWGCGICVEVCPYSAPELVERDGRRYSVINEALCKSCGVCVVNCPVMAITAKHFTHDQIIEMIESLKGKGGSVQ
jgi:heterodisulfide reductase subunit A